VAKLYAYWIIVNYREAYNMFAANGILFNHESPIRGETFVTRKITRAACRIAMGLQETCYIGNLDAKRDWGHAKDYVKAMWLMLQQEVPEDYVIATGVTTSVRDFVKKSFAELGIELSFKGTGSEEVGVVKKCHNDEFQLPVEKIVVKVDPNYYRPTEVDLLIGDATKAKNQLGWEREYDLDGLIKDMVKGDLEIVKKDRHLLDGGHKVMKYYE
jgi:GDPmannose 4,6-dehydratase